MSEIDDTPRTYSGALLAAIAVALLAAVAGLVWCGILSGRLGAAQTELTEVKQKNVKLDSTLRETDARLAATTEALRNSLGLTQKQLDSRAEELMRRQQTQEANTKQLASAQQQTAQQVSAVSNEVTTVKGDVGGVRSELGKTQTDVQSALSQLQSVRGDLSNTNSVIARNHDELVALEHRGDRNYYEFTLQKGQRKPVGTISMELKKTDQKKSKFTVNIYADDKTYEKKDRNLNEPLQFYSGKSPALYVIVVNSIGNKNQISGYLATPKNGPAPITATAR